MTIVDKKQMGDSHPVLMSWRRGLQQQAPKPLALPGNSSFGTHDELSFGFNRREYCSPAATYYDGTVLTTSTVCHGFSEPMVFRCYAQFKGGFLCPFVQQGGVFSFKDHAINSGTAFRAIEAMTGESAVVPESVTSDVGNCRH
jgi:hypothetical protein